MGLEMPNFEKRTTEGIRIDTRCEKVGPSGGGA